jgi:hypothetical protein
MQEFSSVSASSYDPAALAAKLTEKSAEGWSVVSIVPTGGDVTAFLSRESSGASSAAAAPAAVVVTPAVVVAPEPAPAAEPAGWAVAPEVAAPAAAAVVTPAYEPATQPVVQPAAQPAAQAATPAVPAGWYADPAGRFELRYWDGGTWTEHVSRAGQQYTDPPVVRVVTGDVSPWATPRAPE